MSDVQPIRRDEVITVLPRDAIEAIIKPQEVSVDEADAEMAPDEMVVAVTIGRDSRAYPIRVLAAHQVVNDTIGGRPVVVTWCPLCFTSIVYARLAKGREHTFGVSGKLARNALVVYDHQTQSLWSQLSGEAVEGPLEGARLDPVPCDQLNWATWKRRYPQGLALSKTRAARGAYSADPYAGHYVLPTGGLFGAASVDPRLEAKQFVLGLALAGSARAYPYSVLQRLVVVNDVLAGTPVVIVFSGAHQSALAYERYTATSIELTFVAAPEAGPDEVILVDEQSGSRWDGHRGEAISGPWRGWSLNRLPSTSALWSDWREQYPDTGVYSQGR